MFIKVSHKTSLHSIFIKQSAILVGKVFFFSIYLFLQGSYRYKTSKCVNGRYCNLIFIVEKKTNNNFHARKNKFVPSWIRNIFFCCYPLLLFHSIFSPNLYFMYSEFLFFVFKLFLFFSFCPFSWYFYLWIKEEEERTLKMESRLLPELKYVGLSNSEYIWWEQRAKGLFLDLVWSIWFWDNHLSISHFISIHRCHRGRVRTMMLRMQVCGRHVDTFKWASGVMKRSASMDVTL